MAENMRRRNLRRSGRVFQTEGVGLRREEVGGERVSVKVTFNRGKNADRQYDKRLTQLG